MRRHLQRRVCLGVVRVRIRPLDPRRSPHLDAPRRHLDGPTPIAGDSRAARAGACARRAVGRSRGGFAEWAAHDGDARRRVLGDQVVVSNAGSDTRRRPQRARKPTSFGVIRARRDVRNSRISFTPVRDGPSEVVMGGLNSRSRWRSEPTGGYTWRRQESVPTTAAAASCASLDAPTDASGPESSTVDAPEPCPPIAETLSPPAPDVSAPPDVSDAPGSGASATRTSG